VRLPWGTTILVRPYDTIGSNIWHYGIFDLIVCEAIVRLLDTGESGIDIGANIGQMTSLMSLKVGENGKVFSFEPHPDVFAELCTNIQSRDKKKGVAPVSLYNLGLSDREGDAVMEIDPSWANNRGTARIAHTEPKAGSQTVKIQVSTLKKILGCDAEVAVCKIDVEGHELKVFQGAAHLLGQRRIRDILFEDDNPYPSEVQNMLFSYGHTIFSMHVRLTGPLLLPLTKSTPLARVNRRDRPDFLATLDPQRTLERFRGRGWRVLI
jgi:FkbM family methyltransferase